MVPLENFSLIWRRHHSRWRAEQLCTALMAIELWGSFSVLHLLCHGACVYDVHLRGPVTLTPIAESVAEEFIKEQGLCWKRPAHILETGLLSSSLLLKLLPDWRDSPCTKCRGRPRRTRLRLMDTSWIIYMYAYFKIITNLLCSLFFVIVSFWYWTIYDKGKSVVLLPSGSACKIYWF